MRTELRPYRLSFIALAISGALFCSAAASAQAPAKSPVADTAAMSAERQEALQQIANDKASYAAALVLRWESAARDSGRFDANYAQDLFGALMKLQPENLLRAGEATSYDAMRTIIMTGRAAQSTLAKSLGDSGDDLVYTPVTPCRIVDTRVAGGIMVANVSRTFDVDGSSFAAQGGVSTSCGIPFGVANAVAMTLTVTQPAGTGWINAWGLGSQPLTSFVNFVAGATVANTTIVPVVPGSGNDFTVVSAQANSHVIIDVVGYFAAPVATALDCVSATSAVTTVPYNVYTAVDATCPSGYTVTGGGSFPTEGTLGRPQIWIDGYPASGSVWRNWIDNQTGANRTTQTWARCCRVPGR